MNIQNLAGQVLGQYELREVLGFGGMGVAYRAYQTSLEREVAVKVLSLALANEPGYIERFYREAKTAAALEHAHIVPVYDYGVQGDISYVVMRLLTGGSLEQRMKQRTEQNKPLPSLGEVATLVKQLASALDYAHKQGVIHRDIKPANIMFDNQGLAYIVDFGIAKLLETTTAFTASGTPLGTPLFMPPEQWRSEDLTPAADQYALAVTVFALLTGGRLPFEATTPYGMMHKHLNESPTRPQQYRDDVPFAVSRVLEQALEKTPADRFPSVTAFADAFDTAIRGQTGELTNFFTTPVLRAHTSAGMGASLVSISRPEPETITVTVSKPAYKSPVTWVLVAALALVLGVLGVVWANQDDGGPTSTLPATSIIAQTIDAALTQAYANSRTSTAEAVALLPTATPTSDATATRAVEQKATGDALAAQTALDQTATAVVATNQAAVQRQTATQEALDETATAQAQATALAQATATQAVLLAAETETAATEQAEPTATPEPEPSATPAPTRPPTDTPEPPTSTPTPVPANVRLLYTPGDFLVVNISDRALDISQLEFRQVDDEGDVRSFAADEWTVNTTDPARAVDPTQLAADTCLHLLTGPATNVAPDADVCGDRVGWRRTTNSNKHFWIAPADSSVSTFSVVDGSDNELAVCELAAGECAFYLP